MSDDLISRKAVIDILESIRLNDCNAARRYVAADIQESVENLPTAYNVDAVCEELKKHMEYSEETWNAIDSEQYFGEAIACQHAIYIVRNGGKKNAGNY